MNHVFVILSIKNATADGPAAQLADSDKDFEPDLQATILPIIIRLSRRPWISSRTFGAIET